MAWWTSKIVNYRLEDAKIYDLIVDQLMASATRANTTNESRTFKLTLDYPESDSHKWKTTWLDKSEVQACIQAYIEACVPVIDGCKVEISPNSKGLYKWQEEIKLINIGEKVTNVTVPPMTKVKVTMFATKGTCDVPFSYSQGDTLIMHNGIYTGTNYFNFTYKIEEEALAQN